MRERTVWTTKGWPPGRGRRRGDGRGLLVAAGCGQTDFATGVGQTQATLNATITTVEPGAPERAWFQFWPAATPAAKRRTASRRVTSTGPLSAIVTGLAPSTKYAFRLCGRRGTVRACAQTRTFTTSHDAVQAVGSSKTVHTLGRFTQVRGLDVDVTRDDPASRVALELDLTIIAGRLELALGSPDTPNVTCLAVSGHVAEVGFRNAIVPPPNQPYLQYSHATFVDGGPAGSGLDLVSAGPDSATSDPSACPIPTDLTGLLPLHDGDISVNAASTTP